jgi:nuclear GTP-binding protein
VPLDPPHEDATMASEPTLSSLAQLAAATAATSAASEHATSGESGKTKEQLRRHYIRTLHKVVDQADVVLLVLDARDPAGCRSRLVEEEVRRREAEGKRLVFVLNKIGARARRLSLPSDK